MDWAMCFSLAFWIRARGNTWHTITVEPMTPLVPRPPRSRVITKPLRPA